MAPPYNAPHEVIEKMHRATTELDVNADYTIRPESSQTVPPDERRRQPLAVRTAYEWGVVAEVVPNGKTLSRARELAELYLKAPEVTRRNTRVHFIQPLKERIVREVGYGLSLEGASSADLVKSKQSNSEPAARKGKVA